MSPPCAQSGNAKRPWRSVASECLLDAEGRRAMGHPDPGRQPGRYARSLDEPKNTTTPPLTRPRSDFIRLGRTAHDRRRGTFTLSLVGSVPPGTPISLPSSPISICMSPMDVAARSPQPLALDSLVGSTSGRRSLAAPCRVSMARWRPSDCRVVRRFCSGISKDECRAVCQEHGHNPAVYGSRPAGPACNRIVYLRKPMASIGHWAGQGIRTHLMCRDHDLMASPTRGPDSKVVYFGREGVSEV